MKIKITMEIDPDWADSTHNMGVTAEGYERIVDALNAFGDDIDIEAMDR
jgi:hypothetical protein